MKRSTSTCRLRKCSCDECGYTVRVTRAWMLEGLPQCPKHGEMRPSSPADLAFVGLIGIEDVGQAAWNAICRENGWDTVRNHGQYARARECAAPVLSRHSAAHCAYAGCGRWVKDGADRCSAGHAQRENAPAVECVPF